MKYNAIDLFSGCGGLSVGLKKAGFKVAASIERDANASKCYKLNHRGTKVICDDIRNVDTSRIIEALKGEPLHLLAGCPPCQGFSRIRRRNKTEIAEDDRNSLILEYVRFVRELKPLVIMLENVPGLSEYQLFQNAVSEFKEMGYHVDYSIVDVSDYLVPQRRKRLVLLGSLLGELKIPKGKGTQITVRQAIGNLPDPNESNDPAHKIFPTHSERIQRMIDLIPRNGGSRHSLPAEYILECHKKPGIGFRDVYGRLKWDDVSSTITGGCLNPSKGRFLHPEMNRSISAREAALLQTFPATYRFQETLNRGELALMIGNALPPKFSECQARAVAEHISLHKE